MFERRLKFLLIVFACPTIVFVVRLAELQWLRADTYRALTEQALRLRSRELPCLRGHITDRNHRLLAYDAPLWDIAVHYSVIAWRFGGLEPDSSAAKPLFRSLGIKPAKERQRVQESWQAIVDLTGVDVEELQQKCHRVISEVTRIKRYVEQKRGVDTTIHEEVTVHPVVKGLNQDQQVAARIRLASYPWIEVLPSQTRQYEGGSAFGRILGTLNEVDLDTIQNDPAREDQLSRYKPGDLRGITGAEAMGERWLETTGNRWLRGRRGRMLIDATGQTVETPDKPQDGKTLRLTIDWTLQQALYNRLAAVIESHPISPGGAAVILDIPSREVLAMVSYPSFDPNLSYAERVRLNEDDPLRQPFVFRTVAKHYHPGSTVKPAILAAALADGTVSTHTRITCEKYLFAEQRDRFTCTGYHGLVGPVFSVQHSCNIFYYKIGEQMGIPRLAHWLRLFGLGKSCETGLPGETSGNLPTGVQSGSGRGFARSMAIGQWNLQLTPIQAANMTATVASGIHRPVTLWADDPRPRPSTRLPIPEEAWRIVRRGMYAAVNEPGGTAFTKPDFERATLEDDEYVLLGKTGTASTGARTYERLYVLRLPDDTTQEIWAPHRRAALREYPNAEVINVEAYRKWPVGEKDPTDAWFIGYLTARSRYTKPVNDNGLNVAIAVVIEYGGHGGDVAGPVARDMLRSVLLQYRGESVLEPVSENEPVVEAKP